MTSENEKQMIRSMLVCLYNQCAKYPGLVENLELTNHHASYFIKLVFTRQIRFNEYVPSQFIRPHTHMFEAIALVITLSRGTDGIPKYSITQFDWLPKSGHYLPPFTGLYEKIYEDTKSWATTMMYIMDSQRLVSNQVSVIRRELIAKTALIKN
jgi:hypothetical protein